MKRIIRNHPYNESFQVRRDLIPQYHNIWHYHDELEFVYVNKGKGTFFIGDCLQPFSTGDCILIGSNVPHYWLFDDEYLLHRSSRSADVIVVHFARDFAGDTFMALPELSAIRTLIQESDRGFICHTVDDNLSQAFSALDQSIGISKLLLLLQTLVLFGEQTLCPLISEDYISPNHQDDIQRMNAVLHYIKAHYKQPIELNEIAQIAGMTKNSFCRYFKQRTGITLTEFVNKLRVENAKKLLNQPENSIKVVCYESGFNNLVSFHKAFKKLTGTTPKEHQITMFSTIRP